jgi:hypothetical protein
MFDSICFLGLLPRLDRKIKLPAATFHSIGLQEGLTSTVE